MSSTSIVGVATSHVALATGALGNENHAVFNGLLFVRDASEHVYFIILITTLCFGQGLDLLAV